MSVPVAIMSRDGDTRIIAVAEFLDEDLRLCTGGPISDLLTEVVPFAELFPDNSYDVVGVRIVFRENQGLRHGCASRENLREKSIMEGFNNRADLIGCDDCAVKLIGIVGEVFIKLQPSHFARLSVPSVNIESLLDLAATRTDLGFDLVDIVINIHTVSHCPFVAVFLY